MSADNVLIGPYKRTKEIGRGSFATVYEGYHVNKKQLVAIKSIYKGRLNKKIRENLSQEIEILKQLHHPHVVRLLDFHETSRDMHIVLEYCILGDLTTFIRRRDHVSKHKSTRHILSNYPNPRHGGLNEVLSRHFLQQLATAVRFLRERGLVHRDLKPQNLLLLPPPAYMDAKYATPPEPMAGLRTLPMLKVADFGFARPLAEASLADTMCGSPLYMAPEILRSKGPPFRATNHMELVQKIEQSRDHIKFPENVQVSSELKQFIRGLLKVQPSQRMKFDEFFNHNVVTGTIPGLVEGDTQIYPNSTRNSAGTNPKNDNSPPINIPAQSPTDGQIDRTEKRSPKESNGLQRTATTSRRQTLTSDPIGQIERDASRPAKISVSPPERRSSTKSSSPVHQSASHAPFRKHSAELEAEARRNAKTLAAKREMEREKVAREERTAMDIALERDYIFVEKRSVEVNYLADAFAEEMAVATTTPRHALDGRPRGMSQQQRHHSTRLSVNRRTQSNETDNASSPTTAASPNDGTGLTHVDSSPVAHSKALAIRPSSGQRNGSSDTLQRKLSLERKFGYSPTSATNALSKALNMATGRLFGFSANNNQRNGRMSPYNPFPAYPLSNKNLPLDADSYGLRGSIRSSLGTSKAVDEDTRILHIIEECATRSDVVYGFAEVKFKQLVPFRPCQRSDNFSGPSKEEPYFARVNGDDEEEDELTNDAVIVLSEEALVLYVKTLSLLAKSMDIAGAWWVRKNMPPSPPSSVPNSEVVPYTTPCSHSTLVIVGNQVNSVVQWVRKRFNEVLDKAEYCRRRLHDAQQRSSESQRAEVQNGAPTMNTSTSSAAVDQIAMSSGITAEALMYARAYEMSRSAAINELTGNDLAGCEISYLTAIRMLEAVLETDYNDSNESHPEDGASEITINGLQPKDCKVVSDLIAGTRTRLESLRAKMDAIQQQQQSLDQQSCQPGTSN
ncbi:Serine/threonine-protein kinase [Ascosphaera apis ARSEF 7405]|uniref:Serine/threonine-protein kinase ATG1 n=1 Tax=Ascosphaera apis ARSEF 7405 TaxID=392613 RepID=A0A168DTS4_9EURO|nr:Serine/threonine-protein kinase [Ascosphaera apis ARSEF 7405]